MIFLSGIDDIVGVSIPTPPKAMIHPPTNPVIGQPPSTAIPVVPPMRIKAGPTGQIARGPGGDDDSDQGLAFSRTIRPREIGPATATLPAFPVPGAGEEAKSLGPPPIRPGSSGRIRTLQQSVQQNPSEHLLDAVRATMQPLLNTLAELPSDERQKALTDAFNLLSLPDAPAAVERLSLKFMAKGAQPSIAFKEALARVLATNIAIVMPTQYEAARARAVARTSSNDVDGLAGFTDAVKAGVKVVKSTAKVANKIAGVTKDVACSRLGKAAADVREKGTGAAACKAAQVAKGVAGSANEMVNPPKAVAADLPATPSTAGRRLTTKRGQTSAASADSAQKSEFAPELGGRQSRSLQTSAKKSKTWMYVLGGVVLVGAGFYMYTKKAKSADKTPEVPVTK